MEKMHWGAWVGADAKGVKRIKAGAFGAGASLKCQHFGDAEFLMGRLKPPTTPGLLQKHPLLKAAQKRGQKTRN